MISHTRNAYFLRTTAIQDAVDLLARANIRGFVLPHSGTIFEPWIAFVVEGDQERVNFTLLDANAGYLLHYYVIPEDGWGFSLFHKNKPLSRYRCEWFEDGGWRIDNRYLNFDQLAIFAAPANAPLTLTPIAPYRTDNALDRLRTALLLPHGEDDLKNLEAAPADVFAEALLLGDVWDLTYASLREEFRERPDTLRLMYPGLVAVSDQ